MEFNTKLNKIVQSPFEINNTLKTVYQNNVVDNNKKYIITRQDYCRNFVTINKVPISSIKSVLYSLKKKRFISNYKDKHNNIIKGCYIIK